MVSNLRLRVCGVRDVRWSASGWYPRRRSPKLYVEIKIQSSEPERSLKTKKKRTKNNAAQWDKEFTLSAVKDDQEIRFCLYAASTFGRDVMIGVMVCKVVELVSPNSKKELQLFDTPNEPKTQPTGTIVVKAEYIYSTEEMQRLREEEERRNREEQECRIREEIEERQREEDRQRRLQEEQERARKEQEQRVREEQERVAEEKKKAQRLLEEAKEAKAKELDPRNLVNKVGSLIKKLEVLGGFVNTIEQLTKLNPWTELAWQLCTSLYKIVQKQQETNKKVLDLINTMDRVFDFTEDVKKVQEHIKDDSTRLETIITAMLNQVSECAIFVCEYLRPSFVARLTKQLTADSNAKVDEFIAKFTELRQGMDSKVHIHTAIVSSKVLEGVSQLLQSDALKLLNPTIMDSSQRPLCLHGTRENVLQDIMDWAVNVNDNDQSILWLHGLAGTGKSTIATTVATRLHALHRRGAFLFFERDKTDRSSFLRTITAQLANSEPLLRKAISTAIERDRDVVTSHFDRQFAHLLLEPLRSVANSLFGPIIIVIDALDEYGDINSRRSLLSLISGSFIQLPHNVRFLITSRPEADILASFEDKPKILPMPLSEDSVDDIRAYITHQMDRIRKERRLGLTNWPGQTKLEWLVKASEGLFIWASTLSLFLLDSFDPIEQLDRIISSQSNKYARGLDQLYETVLMARTGWGEGLDERFRDVAGIILFCHTPLTDVDIDQLLGLSGSKSCRTIFQNLQSLFDYAPKWPIRPLHASFRDYLTDENRSGGKPWSLVGFDTHDHLTMCCLQVMLKQLRFNICNFETSYKLNREYRDLQERIQKNISPVLEYASRYWFVHLREIRSCRAGLLAKLLSFLKGKVLFWLEVAALISKRPSFRVSVLSQFLHFCDFPMVEDLEALAILKGLEVFFHRYTTNLGGMQAIPHIYISEFIFTPQSPLGTLYTPFLPNRAIESTDIPADRCVPSKIWSSGIFSFQSLACGPAGLSLISQSPLTRNWRQAEISYDGTVQCEKWLPCSPADWVNIKEKCTVISRDLTTIACFKRHNSRDILIFRITTGEISLTDQILGHDIRCPIFHPTNSNLLAYFDRGLYIHDLTRETPDIYFQTDHRGRSLSWSPDGVYLASNTEASLDDDTSIWRIDYITSTATLDGEFNFRGHPLCFHPTHQAHILVQSDEGTISLRDFTSGDQIYGTCDVSTFIDIETPTRATFSPDGSTFATFQYFDRTVAIFETKTGKRYRDPIIAPTPVTQVDYSPDGKQLILVCWMNYLGTQIYIADIHRDLRVSEEDRFNYANRIGQSERMVTSVCFSPDGSKFLTSSVDGTVHVRSTTDCMLLRESWPLEYPSPVVCTVFSIDGNSIYCALKDGTVRTSSGKTLYTPSGGTRVFALKTYISDDSSEERVVVLESDRVVVVSGEGTLIHGPYEIGGTYAPACVSHHGLLAYTDENRDKVLFLNLDAGYSPSSLQMRHETVDAMSLSRDGSVLALWGAPSDRKEPVLDVWDVNTGMVLRSIAPQSYPVDALMFLDISYLPLSNNHRSLVAMFMQGEAVAIQTWNLEDDSNSSIIHYSTAIFDLAKRSMFSLSPNGKNLVMASKKGIVMWDLALLGGDDDHASHSSTASAENSIHSSTMPVNWRMECDGNGAWIIGPNRERLLWVPLDFWPELDPPGSTHVIRRHRRKLDFSRFVHGEDWVKCYQPSEDEEASD